MANPAYQASGARTVQTSGATITLAAPAGITDGDILIAEILSDQNAVTLAGWTDFSSLNSNFNGSFRSNLLWKRASSESGSYVFSGTTLAHGVVHRFNACVASGSPISGTPAVQDYTNSGTSCSVGSVTPADNEALLVYAGFIGADAAVSTYSGGGLTWTERYDNLDGATTYSNLCLATAPQATAGAVTADSLVDSATPFRTFHLFALAPVASAAAYTPRSMLLGVG